MGEMIQFERPDGQTAPGYLATPAAGDKAPALVVIQEWWGLNDQIKGVADRYAGAGYRALVPDLYRGKVTARPDEANHYMGNLDWAGAAREDVRGAARHLARTGSRVGVTGYCMGGALTIIAAVHVPECAAAVCFYGIPPAAAADPREIRVPFLGHFATDDDWCNPKAVGELEQKLTEGKVPFELFRYQAKHAFMNEARPEVYSAQAATLAWDRTLAFWKKHI